MFGAGGVLSALKIGGYANQSAYGGSGPQTLTSLAPGQIYVTLVPTGATQFNAGATDSSGRFIATTASLQENQLTFLIDSGTQTTATQLTAAVNQKFNPLGTTTAAGRPWQDLGAFTTNSGTIQVQLSNLGTGNLAADGVELVRLTPTLPNLQVLNLTGNPLGNDAQITQVGALSGRIHDNPGTVSITEGVFFNPDSNPPVLTQVGPISLPAGATQAVVTLNASDADNDPVYFTATSDSTWVSITITGNQLTLTPTAGFTGTAEITIVAHDGTNSLYDSHGRASAQTVDFNVGVGAIYGTQTQLANTNRTDLEGWVVYLDANGNGVLDPATTFSPFTETISPSSYTNGSVITDPAQRVYLTESLSRGKVYAAAVAGFTTPTLFGSSSTNLWTESGAIFRAEFPVLSSQVSLDFGYGSGAITGGAAFGGLTAYDSNGNVIQRLTTTALTSGGPVQTLTITRSTATIAYITATGAYDYINFTGGTKVTLSNLKFANAIGGSTAGEAFTVTDANGNYSFTNLAPGTQTVAEVPKNGYIATAPTGDSANKILTFAHANGDSYPTSITPYQGAIYFAANDGVSGNELWTLNAGKTSLVIDINPGPGSSYPSNLIVAGGILYFTATDANGQTWLYQDNGTAVTQVKDATTNNPVANPSNLTVFKNHLYFVASDSHLAYWLFEYDGVNVNQITTATTGGEFPYQLLNVNDTDLFFGANDGTFNALFQYDGTNVTVPKDGSGSPMQYPYDMAIYQSNLYFNAYNLFYGYNLYELNTSTNAISNIDSNNGLPLTHLTNLADNVLYFLAGSDGATLYADTATGIAAITDATTNAPITGITNLIVAGGTLYYTATDSARNSVLFKFSGTASTQLTSTANGGTDPHFFTAFGTGLYFSAYDPTHGYEPWKYDGTSAAAVRLADINSGPLGSYPVGFAVSNNVLLFQATNSLRGAELWQTDGTKVTRITDINQQIKPIDSSLSDQTLFNNAIYFSAFDGSRNWLYRNVGGVLSRVNDATTHLPVTDPLDLLNFNNTLLYFSATDANLNPWLYDFNGTNVVQVTDATTHLPVSNPSELTIFQNVLYFTAVDANNIRWLYKFDGTNVTQLKTSTSEGFQAGTLTNVNNTSLDFIGTDNNSKRWLYQYDGRSVTQVVDATTTTPIASPANLMANGSVLYYTAVDASGSSPPWLYKFDGTNVTQLTNSTTGGSSPRELVALGSAIYFRAYDPTHGYELWTYDGTSAAAILAADINPTTFGALGGSSFPTFITVFNNALYFQADDGVTGPELWTFANGLAHRVADIYTGSGGSSPSNFTAMGNWLYFTAFTSTAGQEVWKTDGINVYPVTDINPGQGNSNPQDLFAFNGVLYFSADDGVQGSQLWRVRPQVFSPTSVNVLVQAGVPTAGVNFNVSRVLDIGADQSVGVGVPVTLTASFNDGQSTAGRTFTYLWQVTDNTGQAIANGTGSTFVFTPSSIGPNGTLGVYNVTLSETVTTTATGATQRYSAAAAMSVKDATTLTQSTTSSVFGQPVTYTAIITVGNPGLTPPTGVVTFRDGTAIIGTGTLTTANGITTASISVSSVAVGNHTITAMYGGDLFNPPSLSGSIVQQVSAASTQTSVATTATSQVYGQPLSFTVSVSSTAPGTATPTGKIQFQVDGVNVGSPVLLVNGVALISPVTTIASGNHIVTAVFVNSDGNFLGGTGTLAGGIVVTPAATSVTLTPSIAAPFSGQAVTFTANVASLTPSTAVPTGAVQFVVDGVNLGSPVALVNGAAKSLAINTLSTGNHSVTVIYINSDGNFYGGNSALTLGVAQIIDDSQAGYSQTGTWIPSGTAGYNGEYRYALKGTGARQATWLFSNLQNGLYHVRITWPAFPNRATNAPFSIYDGTTLLATVAVNQLIAPAGVKINGVAFLDLGLFQVSSGALKVVLTNNANNTVEADAAEIDPVARATTSTAIVAAGPASVYGQPVSWNATVTAANSATPTGSIQFQLDGANLGLPIALVNGQATSPTTTTLTPGSHAINAIYSNVDGDFNGSTASLTGGLIVSPASTTTVLTIASSTPTPLYYGQPLSANAIVAANAPSSAIPAGSVQFVIDGVLFGSPIPLVNGVASNLLPALLSIGTHSLTALYLDSSGNFVGSAAALNSGLSVVAAPTLAALTSSAPTPVFGQPTTFTDAVTAIAPSVATPTGSVQFQVDGVNFGLPVSLVNGVAVSSSTSSLAAGNHSVNALFINTDGSFTSTATALTGGLTVSLATTSAKLTFSSPSMLIGQPFQISATLQAASPSTSAPTGTVQFQVDGVNYGTPTALVNGVAILTNPLIPAGNHLITAVYDNLDGNFLECSAASYLPVAQIIDDNQLGSPTILASYTQTGVWTKLTTGGYNGEFSTSAAGTGTNLSTWQFSSLGAGSYHVRVTWKGASNQASNAPFQIYDGNTLLNTIAVNQINPPTGTTVTIGGLLFLDLGVFQVSSGTLRVVLSNNANGIVVADAADIAPVPAVATQTGVTTSTTTPVYGQPITFKATVNTLSTSSNTPTGMIQFLVDGVNYGTAVQLVNGVASTLADASFGVGLHSVTAIYTNIDGNYLSGSGTLAGGVTVTPAPTTTTVTGSTNAPIYGQPLTFTATLIANAPSTAQPVGAVQFVINGVNFGVPIPLVNGIATTPTVPALSNGNYQVSALFTNADGNFIAGGGNLSVSITPAATTTTVTVSAATSTYSQPVTLSAMILANSPSLATPTGSVQFQIDGVNVGTPIALINGVPSPFVIAGISAGNHIVSAVYVNSDGNFQGGTGTLAGGIVVTPAATSVTLIPSIAAPFTGQAVTFTANVASLSPSTAIPTGKVQFVVDGVNLGSPVALVNGAAKSQAINTLGAGNHSVAVIYTNSDGNFNGGNATVNLGVAQLIDDSQAGYSQTGTWIPSGTAGYNGEYRYALKGTGARQATWLFSNLQNGLYHVRITWPAFPNRATNAPFSIYDGTTLLATVAVNQLIAPAGFTINGVAFLELGVYQVSSGSLKVVLTNNANNTVEADAVAIVPSAPTGGNHQFRVGQSGSTGGKSSVVLLGANPFETFNQIPSIASPKGDPTLPVITAFALPTASETETAPQPRPTLLTDPSKAYPSRSAHPFGARPRTAGTNLLGDLRFDFKSDPSLIRISAPSTANHQVKPLVDELAFDTLQTRLESGVENSLAGLAEEVLGRKRK